MAVSILLTVSNEYVHYLDRWLAQFGSEPDRFVLTVHLYNVPRYKSEAIARHPKVSCLHSHYFDCVPGLMRGLIVNQRIKLTKDLIESKKYDWVCYCDVNCYPETGFNAFFDRVIYDTDVVLLPKQKKISTSIARAGVVGPLGTSSFGRFLGGYFCIKNTLEGINFIDCAWRLIEEGQAQCHWQADQEAIGIAADSVFANYEYAGAKFHEKECSTSLAIVYTKGGADNFFYSFTQNAFVSQFEREKIVAHPTSLTVATMNYLRFPWYHRILNLISFFLKKMGY